MPKDFLFQTIQFSLRKDFVYTLLNVKTVLVQRIQFAISTLFSSILPIDMTLSGATTPGQRGPVSEGNEGALRNPQSSRITEASSSDCLVSYPWHTLGESYPFAEIKSVYSTAPTDLARLFLR